jgi:hypothetical protein
MSARTDPPIAAVMDEVFPKNFPVAESAREAELLE